MKQQVLKQLSKGLAPPVLALLVALLGAGLAHAQQLTPAGTTITNSASVDYQDALGNPFTANSEDATVIVGSVYAATISQDRLNLTSAPGTTRNVSFTLTNNSNTATNFTLNFGNDNGAGTPEGDTANIGGGTDIDATSYTLFMDANQNGVADGGEIVVANNGVIAVPGNTGGTNAFGFPTNIASLVLQVQVPPTAINGDQIGSILTVTSASTTVVDLTAGKGYDTIDETVQSLITVSANAVLDIAKSAVLDIANNRISYTLQVTNNGAAVAQNVKLVDQIPTNTTFAEIEQINLSTAAGDRFWSTSAGEFVRMTIGQDAAAPPYPIGGTIFRFDENNSGTVLGGDPAIVPQSITEPAGVDWNDDGITGGTFTGLQFLRANLAPTASVSIVYTVTYNPALAAGTNIVNTFCVQGDLNNSSTDNPEICSNTVITSVPTLYDVDADDTDGNGTPNDGVLGTDEDAVDNDRQYVNRATAGEVVRFNHVITNQGNAADSFTLSIPTLGNTFPAGTTFAYYIGGSSIGTNTGSIPAGGSATITVRATLPSVITDSMATIGGVETVTFDPVLGVYFIDLDTSGEWDGGNGADDDYATLADNEVFVATLRATSTNDPASTKAFDTTELALGSVAEGVVDLANTTITANVAVNADALDLADDELGYDGMAGGAAVNMVGPFTSVDTKAGVITTTTANPGDTIVFPLFVRNEQGSPTSYTVSVDQTITAIPAGWTVTFRPAGGGATFSSTPVTLPEGSQYAFEAVIAVSGNVAQSGAGAYDFVFRVQSNSNAAVIDRKADRIVVSAVCNIVFGAGSQDQVQQNGTVDYQHTVTNNGNQTQTLTMSATQSIVSAGSNVLTGWTSRIRLDTTGNGIVDTDLANLNPGDTIYVNGGSTAVVLGAGKTIALAPGDILAFAVRVFAPSTADLNDKIRTTINITGGCAVGAIIDDTTVALQVRISKTVAVDATCSCDETGKTFTQNNPTAVNPGQCLIWRLTVTNDGSIPANNVVINDQITPFTRSIATGVWGGSNPSAVAGPPASALVYQTCVSENAIGGDCQLAANIVDATTAGTGGTNTVTVAGNNIAFRVGDGANGTTGGSLIGSDSAVGQFCVQVQ